MAALALWLAAAGLAYLSILGAAAMTLLLPRCWWRYRVLIAPHVGWAALVAFGCPLNAMLPFQAVVLLLGLAAVVVLALAARRARSHLWPGLTNGEAWREASLPLAIGAVTYALGVTIYARQGTLSAVLVDSDVEHFADAIAALLHFPIGWSVEAQRGLEATPVGLAYHYVHAILSALTGVDTFTTELPALLLMMWLAVPAVYLFARAVSGLPGGWAALACALYSFCGLPLMVASFGWGQQTAALATVPFAAAALHGGLRRGDARGLALAGLAGALAAGSLYLATAPLVGGIAAALALLEATHSWHRSRLLAGQRMRQALRPLGRLVVIGLIVLAAGALSHVSAAAFLAGNAGQGFLVEADMAGRSTHVSTFASLPAALGVTPLDLFRDAVDAREQGGLRWNSGWLERVAAVCGLALTLVGLATAARRRPAVIAVVVVTSVYAVYLRVLRPFPYGEFKLLSSVWFLVPCLAAAAAAALLRLSGAFRPIAAGTATALVATYALGLLMVAWHGWTFLSLPWGAALPEAEMRTAREVTAAVPRGSTVYVSNQLTPSVAYSWDGHPTRNRAGFPSRAARENYLTRRWKGIVTSLLAFGGRPVYGTVQRYSTELRLPAPLGATDYAILDASEEPRLSGLLPGDLVRSAGTLRLYLRGAAVGALGIPSGLTAGDTLLEASVSAEGVEPAGGLWIRLEGRGARLPAPVMPIGESFPGRLGVPAGAERQTRRATLVRAAGGNVVVGIQALRAAHVEIELRDGLGSTSRRRLALGPGLTWYTTPAVAWPARVTARMVDEAAADGLDSSMPFRVAAVLGAPSLGSTLAEGLDRSASGTVWPLLLVGLRQEDSGVALDGWYSYLGPPKPNHTARLRSGPTLWLAGQSLTAGLGVGPGARRWSAHLLPGQELRQESSDGLRAVAAQWMPDGGEQWLWLDLGPDREPAVYQPAIRPVHVEAGTVTVSSPDVVAATLPLLGSAVGPPRVEEQTLVKGSGDDLFLVEGGRLRWVADVGLLEARRIPWRLTVFDDAALWRLPVGLPLSG